MSVELVTGYFGVDSGGKPKRHVSSAEDGTRQAGTVGLGCYALSTGSKLSATMEDANTLVVADGDVMMNGRHVSLPDPTSFTIPTGVKDQKVSNLAVLRYQKAADSVESVTPVVLTGEPSAGEPTDPAYNEGSILDGDSPVDFPLYRVVTDGINAGDPVPLFDIMLPMAELQTDLDELRDSVSQITQTKSYSGNGFLATLRAGICIVDISTTANLSESWSSAILGTLPAGMRPGGEARAPLAVANQNAVCMGRVFANGTVQISNIGGTPAGANVKQGSVIYAAAG